MLFSGFNPTSVIGSSAPHAATRSPILYLLPMVYVPQGSILGPLLFLFYVNDLPTVVNHCSVSLYADDTVLYCFSSNIKDLENALNEDMSRIALWLNQNKLILNIEKTKSMLIGSDRKLRAATATSVSVFDEEVESVEHFKYLGVTFSSNFTWTEQIEYVKSLFPVSARILFITVSFSRSLIMPTLFGGDKGNAVLTNHLELQNKANKTILDRPFHSSAADGLDALGWLTLEKRRHFHRCLYVYKCVNVISAHSMGLLANKDVHGYDTRHKDNLRLSRVR